MQVRTDSAVDSRCYWAAICLISFALMNQCVSVQPRLVARPVRLASQPNCPGDVAPASAGHAWANCAWARRSERCKHPWALGACGPLRAGDWALSLACRACMLFCLWQPLVSRKWTHPASRNLVNDLSGLPTRSPVMIRGLHLANHRY